MSESVLDQKSQEEGDSLGETIAKSVHQHGLLDSSTAEINSMSISSSNDRGHEEQDSLDNINNNEQPSQSITNNNITKTNNDSSQTLSNPVTTKVTEIADDYDDDFDDDLNPSPQSNANKEVDRDNSKGRATTSQSSKSNPPRQRNNSTDQPPRRRAPKANAYTRLVGRRRSTQVMTDDISPANSVLAWAKDKILGVFVGESAEERRTRQHLAWYKQVLLAELEVVDRARSHFNNHGKDLAVEFEIQELQLQKWGLLNILPAFRMQAWTRVSRSALLEDMALVAERILRLRLARSQDVISLFATDTKSGQRKHSLESYNAFCLPPDAVMAKEAALTQLGHRLARMDKVCQNSLHIFKTMMPELESRTFVQRKHMLVDIVARYSQVTRFSFLPPIPP